MIRGESIEDLYISGDFDIKKIKCNALAKHVSDSLDEIYDQRLENERELNKVSLKLMYLNVRSHKAHHDEAIGWH